MTPARPVLTAGAPYWALLEGGPYAGNIVELVAESEDPVDRLPLSDVAGDALYEYQGTGAQGSLHYLHHYACIAEAGPAIGSTRPA